MGTPTAAVVTVRGTPGTIVVMSSNPGAGNTLTSPQGNAASITGFNTNQPNNTCTIDNNANPCVFRVGASVSFGEIPVGVYNGTLNLYVQEGSNS